MVCSIWFIPGNQSQTHGFANINVEATNTTQTSRLPVQFIFFSSVLFASCVPKGATHLLGTNISLKGFLKTSRVFLRIVFESPLKAFLQKVSLSFQFRQNTL